MKMEKGMKYEAPAVEVLAVEVELGFAGSLGTGGDANVPGIDDGDFE